jgi:hypothetical protein
MADLLIEVALDLEPVTGEVGAVGTADAIVLDYAKRHMTVADLKYGAGYAVDVGSTLQLPIYGLAALHKYAPVADFDTVTLAIVQPRNGGISTMVLTQEEMLAIGTKVLAAAGRVREAMVASDLTPYIRPGSDACRFCLYKVDCPQLRAQMQRDLADEPATMSDPQLAALLSNADLYESVCADARTEALRRAHAGIELPGWKLVNGRAGHRAWTNDAQVITALKQARLAEEQIFEPRKLITPAAAERKLKDNPDQWAALAPLITQKSGSPTLAPVSDKRPALMPTALSLPPVTAIPL